MPRGTFYRSVLTFTSFKWYFLQLYNGPHIGLAFSLNADTNLLLTKLISNTQSFSCLFVKQTRIIITCGSTGPRPPHTLGRLLWTCDQPVAKASTYTGQKNIETQRQPTKPRGGFEPTIPVNKRPRPTSLDRAAAGTGNKQTMPYLKLIPTKQTYIFTLCATFSVVYWLLCLPLDLQSTQKC
jgi:hypothetical protein